MSIARDPNHPGAPLHPGAMLREEFMEPLGVSVEALAEEMGVSTARVAGIVAERRGISADTAGRLGSHFGMSARFWMNLQSNYELAVAYMQAQSVITKGSSATSGTRHLIETKRHHDRSS